jgi:hypothetical protein
MMKVKDLVKGQVYALQCPINNYALKPFVFDRIKPHRNIALGMNIYECYFFGMESPNLIYPVAVLLDETFTKVLDYGTILATPLTSLEMELL